MPRKGYKNLDLDLYPLSEIKTARISIGETSGVIKSESSRAIDEAVKSIKKSREILKNYLEKHPEFQFTLKPMNTSTSANTPEIIRRMVGASRIAGVGPMASVAGAIIDIAVEKMVSLGARMSLIEDGGEISSMSCIPVTVGIYAGDSPLSERLALTLTKEDSPIGIGTSSAKVGRALSLGEADAAIAIAGNAALADAAATKICNVVRGRGVKKSVRKGLLEAKRIPSVRGAIIIRGDVIGTYGRIPQLCKVVVNDQNNLSTNE